MSLRRVTRFFLKGKEDIDLNLRISKDRVEDRCIIIQSSGSTGRGNHYTSQSTIAGVRDFVLQNLRR